MLVPIFILMYFTICVHVRWKCWSFFKFQVPRYERSITQCFSIVVQHSQFLLFVVIRKKKKKTSLLILEIRIQLLVCLVNANILLSIKKQKNIYISLRKFKYNHHVLMEDNHLWCLAKKENTTIMLNTSMFYL